MFSEENADPFRPGSDPFETSVYKVQRVVASLLRSMRRRKQAIFVGDCTSNVRSDWNSLANELKRTGFDVRPDTALHRGFNLANLADRVIGDDCRLAVFVIGGTYDRFVHDIIEFVLARTVAINGTSASGVDGQRAGDASRHDQGGRMGGAGRALHP